jgi:nitrous oxidase accessory protein
MRSGALTTLGLLALGALACGAPSRARQSGSSRVFGPRVSVTRAEGAVLASSFEELRALVSDPAGPHEIELAAGVHHGDLVVKRPLSLRGQSGAVLQGSGNGTVLSIDTDDAAVENLVVRRSGHRHTSEDAGIKAKGHRNRISNMRVEETLFGILLGECHDCLLEGSHVEGYGDDSELRGDGIKLWESHGSTVRGCEVVHARDLVVWYTRHATLEDNTVRHSRYGSHFMYAHDAVIRRSHFEDNVVGIFVMYSARLRVEDNVLAGAHGAAGIGLGFKDSDDVTASRNWLVANTTGTYLDNTPRTPDHPVLLEGNVLALNDVALRLHGADKGNGIALRGNDFRDNPTMVEVDGGGDAMGLTARGNHYSDYEGYDLDHDGTGDVAYEIRTLSSELTETHPSLKFFHGTPALGAIDAVSHAVPVLSQKKLFRDPAPLFFAPQVSAP